MSSFVSIQKTAACRIPHLSTRVCTIQLGASCVLVTAGGSTISAHLGNDVFTSPSSRGSCPLSSSSAKYDNPNNMSRHMDTLSGQSAQIHDLYASCSARQSNYSASTELANVVRTIAQNTGTYLPHLIHACQADGTQIEGSRGLDKHYSAVRGSASDARAVLGACDGSASQLQLSSGLVTCMHVCALPHTHAALGVVGTTAGTLLLFRIDAASAAACAPSSHVGLSALSEVSLSSVCSDSFMSHMMRSTDVVVDVGIVMDPAARAELVVAATASCVVLLDLNVFLQGVTDARDTQSCADVWEATRNNIHHSSGGSNGVNSNSHNSNTNISNSAVPGLIEKDGKDGTTTPAGSRSWISTSSNREWIVKLVLPFPRIGVVRVLVPQRLNASFAMDIACMVVLGDGVMYYVERLVKGGSVHLLHGSQLQRQQRNRSEQQRRRRRNECAAGLLDYGIMHRNRSDESVAEQPSIRDGDECAAVTGCQAEHKNRYECCDSGTSSSPAAAVRLPHVVYAYRLSGVTVHLACGAGAESNDDGGCDIPGTRSMSHSHVNRRGSTCNTSNRVGAMCSTSSPGMGSDSSGVTVNDACMFYNAATGRMDVIAVGCWRDGSRSLYGNGNCCTGATQDAEEARMSSSEMDFSPTWMHRRQTVVNGTNQFTGHHEQQRHLLLRTPVEQAWWAIARAVVLPQNTLQPTPHRRQRYPVGVAECVMEQQSNEEGLAGASAASIMLYGGPHVRSRTVSLSELHTGSGATTNNCFSNSSNTYTKACVRRTQGSHANTRMGCFTDSMNTHQAAGCYQSYDRCGITGGGGGLSSVTVLLPPNEGHEPWVCMTSGCHVYAARIHTQYDVVTSHSRARAVRRVRRAQNAEVEEDDEQHTGMDRIDEDEEAEDGYLVEKPLPTLRHALTCSTLVESMTCFPQSSQHGNTEGSAVCAAGPTLMLLHMHSA